MSLGTILLIVLIIALLGGFGGIGGPLLRYGLLRRRRARPDTHHGPDTGRAWQALIRGGGRQRTQVQKRVDFLGLSYSP